MKKARFQARVSGRAEDKSLLRGQLFCKAFKLTRRTL